MSSIESLHRMTRDERDLRGLIVAGSDHLTTYNLYAEAFACCRLYRRSSRFAAPFIRAEAINKWAEERGVLVKSIEDAALAMACVFRSVNLPLPEKMPLANIKIGQRFTDLLAQFMPFDLVIDGQHVRRPRSARFAFERVQRMGRDCRFAQFFRR